MLGEPNFAVQDAIQPALLGAELPPRAAHAMHPGRQRRTCRIGGNRASWWPAGSHNGAKGGQMRAAWGRSDARLPLVLPPLVLALLLLQGGAAADMAYSEPMRLQSPAEWKIVFCSFLHVGSGSAQHAEPGRESWAGGLSLIHI